MKIRNISILLSSFLVLAFFFQNCSRIDLFPTAQNESLSCDPSVYNIAREAQTINGQTIYFVQQNNHDISNEYAGTIEWVVKDGAGTLQTAILVHENRLLLDCETHPEEIEITAKLITDCGTEIEIFHSDSAPNTCEEEAPPTPVLPPEPGPEVSYCDEYKAKYPGVENEPGFQDHGLVQAVPNLERMTSFFSKIQASKWKNVIDNTHWMTRDEELLFLSGRGAQNVYFANFIGKPEMYGKYIALKLTIPASAPDMLLKLSYAPDGQGPAYGGGRAIVSISPCPGDFRFYDRGTPPALGQGQSEFVGIRGPNSFYGGGESATIGITDTPNSNSTFNGSFFSIWVPKGKTFYINATYNLNYNTSLGSEYLCPDNPIPDYFSPEQRSRLEVFGCGGLLELDRSCFANGQKITCPN